MIDVVSVGPPLPTLPRKGGGDKRRGIPLCAPS